MVMVLSRSRHNGSPHGGSLSVVSEPDRRLTQSCASGFAPKWKSRFARSQGYIPERDGPTAPPLQPADGGRPTAEKQTVKPAPREAPISDPAAAGAA